MVSLKTSFHSLKNYLLQLGTLPLLARKSKLYEFFARRVNLFVSSALSTLSSARYTHGQTINIMHRGKIPCLSSLIEWDIKHCRMIPLIIKMTARYIHSVVISRSFRRTIDDEIPDEIEAQQVFSSDIFN